MRKYTKKRKKMKGKTVHIKWLGVNDLYRLNIRKLWGKE